MSLTSNKYVQWLFVAAAVLTIIVAVKSLSNKKCSCQESTAVEPI